MNHPFGSLRRRFFLSRRADAERSPAGLAISTRMFSFDRSSGKRLVTRIGNIPGSSGGTGRLLPWMAHSSFNATHRCDGVSMYNAQVSSLGASA